MLSVDWNYVGISRIWREKYIEFLKLRENAPRYTYKFHESHRIARIKQTRRADGGPGRTYL
jgi:hypothetical protein